jgi:hypothetical protein
MVDLLLSTLYAPHGHQPFAAVKGGEHDASAIEANRWDLDRLL